MKKLLSIIVLTLLCTVLQSAYAATYYDFTVGGIYYKITDNGVSVTSRVNNKTISSYNDREYYMSYSGDVVIPSSVTYNDVTYNVTGIGYRAFYICEKLTSATIPNGITKIEEGAFSGCSMLASANIPSSVTSIGDDAFYGCAKLTSINIPDGMISIGEEAFRDCSSIAPSLIIPNSVTSIGGLAFYGCKSLTSVTIGNGVTNMGSNAFEHVTATELIYAEGCKTVFATGITTMRSVYIPQSVTAIADKAFWACTNLVSVVLPNNLTSIGEYAFNACDNLVSINIPNTVNSIGRYAFRNCTALPSILIPSGVTNIGDYAFNGCSKLSTVINLSEIPQTITTNTFSKHGTLHVREGYKDVYAATKYWKDFNIIDDIPGPEMIFPDGVAYTVPVAFPVDKVTYTRTFSNTNWQALYVPFSLDYEEWSEKYDIAEINNFVEYDDDDNGVYDRTFLVVLKMTSGCTEPNTPYLIRAKETGTHNLVLQDKTLEAAESNSIDCRSVKNEYTFMGTYTEVPDMYANGYYAMSGGALKMADAATVTLKPQRWYLAITSRTDGSASAKAQSIQILEDGEEGINAPSNSLRGASPVAYDLTGRVVSTTNNAHGVNIVNGKKIIK